MAAPSYSIPKLPVEPGAEVKNEDMKIIESMPVKSLVSYPKSGAIIKPNQALEIRGHAWTGAEHITKVEYSIDFGATWHACNLEKAANRYSWQHFKAKINFPQEGYYEVWAKATDNTGLSQPMVTPGWNPKGYLNNACHRIAIKVS